MRPKEEIPPRSSSSSASRSWLKLSLEMERPVTNRADGGLRWKGKLVLTGSIAGREVKVPLANCRAQVDWRPPPLGRDVLLRLLGTALEGSPSRIPQPVDDTLRRIRERLQHERHAARRVTRRAAR